MNFIIDKEKLQNLLQDFFTLTKTRIVVFDTDFNEICCFPNTHSEYCKILRECEKSKKKCSLCDKEAFIKAKNTEKTVIYRCYAGLIEAVTPIKYGDIQVGYLMFGQILQTDNYDRSWQEILPIISEFDINVEKLKKAYYKKKNIGMDIIDSASSIMQACSGYLYLSKMIQIQSDSIENRIDKYITTHLTEELSAEKLCSLFLISKNRLYEISKYSYGCGIAEHIRTIRVQKAKTLLSQTDKKVYEIAELCGISDYNYFTKIFKKYTGCTPKKFVTKSNTNYNHETSNNIVQTSKMI